MDNALPTVESIACQALPKNPMPALPLESEIRAYLDRMETKRKALQVSQAETVRPPARRRK